MDPLRWQRERAHAQQVSANTALTGCPRCASLARRHPRRTRTHDQTNQDKDPDVPLEETDETLVATVELCGC
jgi:hypothetical protein